MGEHALVVFDGSTESREHLDFALACEDVAALVVLYVVDPFEADHAGPFPPLLGYWGSWYAEARERADSTVADARERAASRDVPAETVVRRGRTPAVAAETAAEYGVDRVVVTERAHGVLSRVTGTTAGRIVRAVSVPVTIV